MSYLSFKVIAETRYLQTIRICGNHPVLGQWDPHQSYPLTTTVSSYPEWTHESRIQIDPSHLLEFKCLIQDGQEFIWESVANRVHRCDYRRNFLIVRFNGEMNVRTFQKYEISHEFVQEELLQVQRLTRSRDYQPFETDSSDTESLPELVKQLTGTISIRQLDSDWRETIKSHYECKLKQKSISKFRKFSEHYGSPDLVFNQRKRSSQQIFTDSYVVCLSLKIPLKITPINNALKILHLADIKHKYHFELTQDPYLLSMYDLFNSRLSLQSIWIGWMGVSIQDQTEFQLLQQYVYEQYKCFGIDLEPKQLDVFSQFIEPIFNNMTPNFSCEDDYIAINRVFARYVSEAMFCTLFTQYQHLHSLFIFDYHLFLVPLFIKDGLIKKNEYRPRICTIMRRTFPSPKQFRILQCSQMMLSSLLMSDLISVVQLKCLHYFVQCLPFQYQKMTQISGISAFTIEVLGRKVILDYGSVGLNYKNYTVTETQSDTCCLLGVDSLSTYSGLKLKFQIVDQLPCQLIQVLYTNNEDDYENNHQIQDFKSEILDIAQKINNKHGFQKIKVIFDRNDLIQYYGMADIFFKTSLRESTSTTYLEYIHVRQSLGKTAKLVLSQWCHFKVEHLKINPNDIKTSAQSILNYLNDKKPTHINVPNSNDWLHRLNDHLSYCEDYWMDKQLYDSSKELTVGLKDRSFSQVETSKIISKFQSNIIQDNQRVIILAYTEHFKQKVHKLDQLVQAFEQLSQDDYNTLIIISDQECELMELTFGSIKNLYIIAQDGLFIKQNNQTTFQQIVDRDEIVEAKLQQISYQENFSLSEKNLTYSLSLKEKIQDTSAAANILIQNLMRELRTELDEYLVIQQGYTVKVKHQYLQVDELLKMIINQEVNQKGLISLANIISFDREWLDRIIQIFQHVGMPLNKKFHCVSISDQIGKNSNLVLENTQEIILLLNKYANT